MGVCTAKDDASSTSSSLTDSGNRVSGGHMLASTYYVVEHLRNEKYLAIPLEKKVQFGCRATGVTELVVTFSFFLMFSTESESETSKRRPLRCINSHDRSFINQHPRSAPTIVSHSILLYSVS